MHVVVEMARKFLVQITYQVARRCPSSCSTPREGPVLPSSLHPQSRDRGSYHSWQALQIDESVEALIRLEEQQRLKLVRAIQRNPSPDLDSLRSEISEEIIRDIEQIVGDIPNESLEQWTRELGLLQLYDVGYRLFSNDVHSKPRAFEHYLE